MKKQSFKTKLLLNSQTIRRLRAPSLQDVQGGRPVTDSDEVCIPTINCRGCG